MTSGLPDLLLFPWEPDLQSERYAREPVEAIVAFLACFDHSTGEQRLNVPPHVLVAMAGPLLKFWKGEAKTLDAAFGGRTAQARNVIRMRDVGSLTAQETEEEERKYNSNGVHESDAAARNPTKSSRASRTHRNAAKPRVSDKAIVWRILQEIDRLQAENPKDKRSRLNEAFEAVAERNSLSADNVRRIWQSLGPGNRSSKRLA